MPEQNKSEFDKIIAGHEDDTIKINNVDIPRHVYNTIRYQVNESQKNDLVNKFGSVIDNPEELIKLKMNNAVDKIKEEIDKKISNTKQKNKEPDKVELDKLIANSSAQIKSEYEIRIKDMQKGYNQELLKRDMIQKATSKNLLPEFQGEFIYNVQNDFKFDPEDEVYKFRTADGNPFINKEGKPGDVNDVVNYVSEKKPMFFQNTKSGAGTHSGNGIEKKSLEGMTAGEMVKHGLKQKGFI